MKGGYFARPCLSFNVLISSFYRLNNDSFCQCSPDSEKINGGIEDLPVPSEKTNLLTGDRIAGEIKLGSFGVAVIAFRPLIEHVIKYTNEENKTYHICNNCFSLFY